MYTAFGGSGLGLSYRDTEELDLADINDLLEQLGNQRTLEAQAMKK